MSDRTRSSRRSTRDKRRFHMNPLRWIVSIAVLLVVVIGVVFALQALKAADALQSAAKSAERLQDQLIAGENEAAKISLGALQDQAATAESNTDGPLWAAATILPVVGDSIDAVRVSASSLDDIARRGLPPVVDTASTINSDLFKPKDGRFDLETFTELAPAITTASDVLSANADRILAINRGDLVGPLVRPIAEVQDKLASAQRSSDAAARALRLVPEMLGGNGTRRYLLLVQTNAEVRATGGLPGAYAVMKASNGKVELELQGEGNEMPKYDDDTMVDLTEEELFAFGSLMGTDFRDVNFTPEFPRASEVAAEMIRREYGFEVDGVAAIDPVTLGYVLAGTGTIDMPIGPDLTADNAADELLYGVYDRYPVPDQQDAYFEAATLSVFKAVLSGTGDWRKVLEGFTQATNERRTALWFADEDLQREITGTLIAGEFPADEKKPTIGVYLNDMTESKMQYFLRHNSRVRATTCNDDRSQNLTVSTTFTSTAPNKVNQIPRYVTGSKQKRGTQTIRVHVFAPAGGSVDEVILNGEKQASQGDIALKGRPYHKLDITLAPGEELTLTTRVTTAPGATADTRFTSTPGVWDSAHDVRVPSSCR